MEKPLSRAQGTRLSVSGTHSQSVRVARRVARAGLTTGGSFDDTTDDTCAWNFSALTVMAFVLFFSLVMWILALRFDIPFSYPPHLQYSISHRPPLSLRIHPICTPQSHSHDTYTYYTAHTTHASIFFAFILFFHTTVSRSHPRVHLDLCSILYSPFVPIVLP